MFRNTNGCPESELCNDGFFIIFPEGRIFYQMSGEKARLDFGKTVVGYFKARLWS